MPLPRLHLLYPSGLQWIVFLPFRTPLLTDIRHRPDQTYSRNIFLCEILPHLCIGEIFCLEIHHVRFCQGR